MNDFTQEELELICVVLDTDPWAVHDDLVSKIKSMIDNYDVVDCAHPAVPGGFGKCLKCGDIFK